MNTHRVEMFLSPKLFLRNYNVDFEVFLCHKVILKRDIFNTETNFHYDIFKSGTGAEEEENRQYQLAIAKCRPVHTNANKVLLRIKEEVAKTPSQRPTERLSNNSRGSKQS